MLKRYIIKATPDTLLPRVENAYDQLLKAVGARESLSTFDSELSSEFFGSSTEFEAYKDELDSTPVSPWIEEAENRLEDRLSEGLGNYDTCVRYYCLVRKLSPDLIVETGVRHGQSTLFLLAALEMNGCGSLVSVDYPLREDEATQELIHRNPNCVIPSGEDPGWIIPSELTHRWELIEGPSQRHLVDVLADVGEVGMFIHDSEHSLNCMLFEFEATWPRLIQEGVLISDDIGSNSAWDAFVNSKGINRKGKIANNVAYAVKER